MLYARFAESDPVRRIVLRGGRFKSKITASPVAANVDGDPLPIIELSATGTSKQAAIVNTKRASNALVKFIRQQQEVNDIPVKDRVVLQVIETPKKAKLLAGRPKVVPIFIFVGVMGLVIGLAFLLENLRPVATPAEYQGRAGSPLANAGLDVGFARRSTCPRGDAGEVGHGVLEWHWSSRFTVLVIFFHTDQAVHACRRLAVRA